MNAVMIIPTGIGCEIGGHAGDATPVAKLLAACCDKLVLHPNVVNASDINEMPSNSLYVEGSMLDRFLEGEIELQEVRQNKILVATNSPVHNETINAVSAARATLGVDAEILELKERLQMIGSYQEDGSAGGIVHGWESLIEQVRDLDFDALAIATSIHVEKKVKENYWNNGGVNPWGGVEAIASKLIATKLNKPVAHAPVCMDDKATILFETDVIVDPRMGAEIVSYAFLYCVLKGLHKAPRIGNGLSAKDIDFMVTPHSCWGRPHEACVRIGITIIEVLENITCLDVQTPTKYYVEKKVVLVQNYLEAAGYVMTSRAGICPASVKRPLSDTKIL